MVMVFFRLRSLRVKTLTQKEDSVYKTRIRQCAYHVKWLTGGEVVSTAIK